MKIKYGRKYYSRSWSNDELRYVLNYFPDYSSVINVSGWKDEDKEGVKYREYFPKNIQYAISNYQFDKARGFYSSDDILLNLDEPLPKELEYKFDIAFNHTVLEHVKDPFFSFCQISKLAKMAVITVVPFMQHLHFEADSYGDYFRFTPFSMRKLYEDNGLHVIYESYTPAPALIVYLFYVGVRNLEQFKDFPRKLYDLKLINGKIGKCKFHLILKFYAFHMLNKLYNILI